MSKPKIKALIREVVIANRIIRTMIELGYSPEQMIEIIRLAKEMHKQKKS